NFARKDDSRAPRIHWLTRINVEIGFYEYAIARQSRPYQDFPAEFRQRDIRMDPCLERAKPSMDHVCACDRSRLPEGSAVTSVPQRRPGKVTHAFLAGFTFAEKQGVRAS
ncbi:MAG: hypothetical protein WA434_19005, partial [Candidatus Acidiferrales bacterium]